MAKRMSAEETSNPYAGPLAEADTAPVAVDFAEIIRYWEKGRIVYNGVLTLFTLLFTFAGSHFFDLRYWLSIMVGAVVANTCYFFGPVIEGYGRYFGVWKPYFSRLLFAAGLIFASLLAFLSILTYR